MEDYNAEEKKKSALPHVICYGIQIILHIGLAANGKGLLFAKSSFREDIA